MRHIPGLDAIRLVCALIVALGHFTPDLTANLRLLGPLAGPMASVVRILFNGPAAVIVFFVLSGFVIHRPYAQGKPFAAGEYYARRYLRIVPPTIAAALIYIAVGAGPPNGDWNETVLWSVFCELVYYTLYPLILWSGMRIGIVTAAAYAVALGQSFGSPAIVVPGANYSFGHWTWVIGLPCWLSGAWLAARGAGRDPVSAATIWAWRGGVLATSIGLRIVKFHGLGLGLFSASTVHLTLFALLATAWIAREVRFWSARPSRWLDRPGRASFSIYLLHPVALVATRHLTGDRGVGGLALFMVMVGVVAGAFYVAIERPSHRLARWAGRGRAAMSGSG